jgi:hypothetical protein
VIPYKIKVILDAVYSREGGVADEASASAASRAATTGCIQLLVIYAARAVLSHGGGFLQRIAGERLARDRAWWILLAKSQGAIQLIRRGFKLRWMTW